MTASAASITRASLILVISNLKKRLLVRKFERANVLFELSTFASASRYFGAPQALSILFWVAFIVYSARIRQKIS